MIWKFLDSLVKPAARLLDRDSMQMLGVNNTMKVARAYNSLRYGRHHEYRKQRYRDNFQELIEENGDPVAPVNEIKDGWVIDTSGKLPFLEHLLKDADEIIKERGGVKRYDYGRPFFQELILEEHFKKYPSILDFATSSDVLSTICEYLEFIPVLSNSLPYGVRLIESWNKFDDAPDKPLRASQFFHLDYHDKPMTYAIVLLRDVTMENGPFCFLPKSVSEEAVRGLGNYHSKKGGHRVSDERMYSIVSERELIKFCYPAGTVVFLDNSACFHYGSRNAVKPRYLMMFAYLSSCRTDFGDVWLENMRYPVNSSDSRLRRMVLDKGYID
jgi:hypothetical protein